MRLLMITQAVDLDHNIVGFAHSWINALARHVDHVYVLTSFSGRHHLAKNVTLHTYRSLETDDVPLHRHWFFHRHFARLILGGKVDAIFSHMIPKWVIMAKPYAFIRSVPIVLWYTHRARSRQLQWGHRFADHVVTASPESYPFWGGPKVTALGHGIDTSLFKPGSGSRQLNGRFQILSVGRLSPVKQHHLIIEAMRLLVYEYGLTQVQLRIIGGVAIKDRDEAYCQALSQSITQYKLNTYVTLVGPLPYHDVVDEYHDGDLLINLSQTGSLDKVVLEAMACGVPVITSNQAFAPLLQPINNNLYLPHGTAMEVATAVSFLLTMSQQERNALGISLRQTVKENHQLDRLMKKLVQIIESPC